MWEDCLDLDLEIDLGFDFDLCLEADFFLDFDLDFDLCLDLDLDFDLCLDLDLDLDLCLDLERRLFLLPPLELPKSITVTIETGRSFELDGSASLVGRIGGGRGGSRVFDLSLFAMVDSCFLVVCNSG